MNPSSEFKPYKTKLEVWRVYKSSTFFWFQGFTQSNFATQQQCYGTARDCIYRTSFPKRLKLLLKPSPEKVGQKIYKSESGFFGRFYRKFMYISYIIIQLIHWKYSFDQFKQFSTLHLESRWFKAPIAFEQCLPKDYQMHFCPKLSFYLV